MPTRRPARPVRLSRPLSTASVQGDPGLVWENLAKTWLCVGLFLTPLAVSTLTTDSWETPKLYVLLGAITLGWLAYFIAMLRRKTVSWTWHPLDWLVLCLISVVGISTITSVHIPTSLWGIGGWSSATLPAMLGFAALYFLLVQVMVKRHDQVLAWGALIGGTGVSLLFALAQFSNFSVLPAPLSDNLLVTTLSNSLPQVSVLAALVGSAVLLLWSRTRERWARWGIMLVTVISWLVLLFLGQALGWAVFAVGMMAVVLDQALLGQGANTKLLSVAVGLAAVGMIVQLTHVAQHTSLPVSGDVVLDQATSRQIAWAAFKDRPVLGSGPSTWYQDFVQFRPTSFNSSPYWSARFIKGTNEAWQLLAMGGITTVALWVGLLLMAGWWLWQNVRRRPGALVVAGLLTVIVVVIAAVMSTWSFVLLLWLWAALGLSRSQLQSRAEPRPIGVGAPLLFAAMVLGTVVLWYPALRGLFSDMAYHRGSTLYSQTKPLNQVTAALNTALAIDRKNDKALILLANAEVTQAQLATQQQQNPDLNNLLNSAVNHLNQAVAVNPRNPATYESMNNVLNRMSAVVSDAAVQANRNFVTLEGLEPTNPIHDVGDGQTLLAIRSNLLASAQSSTTSEAQAKQLLTKAAAAFQRALTKKPDYLQARFALAQALDVSGQYQDSLAQLDQVQSGMASLNAYWVQRTVTLVHLKNLADADVAFAQATSLTPDDATYLAYATALLEAKQPDKAKTVLQAGLKLNPQSSALQDKLKSL